MLTLISQAEFGTGLKPIGEAYNTGSKASAATATENLEQMISTGIGALTVLGGLFFIFQFVLAGINWISAGGEQGKIQKARDKMTQSVIGLVVIVFSYGIIGLIGSLLGLEILRPSYVLLQQIRPL